MTEQEAKAWVAEKFGATSVDRLEKLRSLVEQESQRQNLVARSTIAALWTRHIVDSAQLVPMDTGGKGLWLDVGTGGGFPGLVVAMLIDRPIVLCEPRKLRATFLNDALHALGPIPHASVAATKVENLTALAGTISARAVAPLPVLIASARGCSDRDTRWLLPRGKSLDSELDMLPPGAVFHVEHSVSDPEARILVLRGIR